MNAKTRNRANWISGWVLALGMFAAAVALDPLTLYNKSTDGGFGFDSFNLSAIAVMAMVSLGGYSFFSKPYVTVRGGQLVVQNPLKRWQLPLSEVDVVHDSYPYASVRIREKRVWLLATERSTRSLMVGDTRLVDRINEHAESEREQVDPGTCCDALARWTPVDLVQAVILALWMTYVVAAYIHSVA